MALDGVRSIARTFLMRSGLAICVMLALVGPAASQEVRPTLDKIKETGVLRLGYRGDVGSLLVPRHRRPTRRLFGRSLRPGHRRAARVIEVAGA